MLYNRLVHSNKSTNALTNITEDSIVKIVNAVMIRTDISPVSYR